MSKKKKILEDHARLGASNAERWMNCPSAPVMEDHFIDNGSIYADEGTLAHALAERCLREGANPLDYMFYNQGDFDHLDELDKLKEK